MNMSVPRLFTTLPKPAFLVGLMLAGVVLAGCGYQPLYGHRTGKPAVSADMARVQIMPTADRPGQILTNFLKDRMHPNGVAADANFRLFVALRERKQDIGVRSDSVATRANLILRAVIKIEDIASARTVFTTRESAIVSYNILIDNPYGTTIAERRSRRAGLETLAENITRRVALFLNRRRIVREKGKPQQ